MRTDAQEIIHLNATIRRLRREVRERDKALAIVRAKIPDRYKLDALDDDARTGQRRIPIVLSLAEMRALAPKRPAKKRSLTERLRSYDTGLKQGPPPKTQEQRAELAALERPTKRRR